MKWRRLQILRVCAAGAVFLAGMGLGAVPGAGAQRWAGAPGAPAGQAGGPPFQPITVVSTGPTMSGGIYLGGLPVQGDWVGYTLGNTGCGHCQPYVHTIRLRNMLTTREISIHAATFDPYLDQVQGATGIQFAGPYLLWHQPGAVANPRYQAGSFACSLCLYDIRTGQGGPVPALQGPAGAIQDQLVPVALGPIYTQPETWRALLLANGPDFSRPAQLYTANLRTGETRPLPADIPLGGSVVAAVAWGPLVAWAISAYPAPGRLFVYNESADRARQIAPTLGAFNGLQSSGYGGDLFWSGADNALYRWRATTDTVEPLPGRASNFVVSSGDHLAWEETPISSPHPPTLKVMELSSGVVILQTPLGGPGADGKVVNGPIAGLADDKISLLSEDERPDGPPSDQRLSVAWLLDPHPAFARLWGLADAGIAAGHVARSWLWGPRPRFLANEAYVEAGDGAGKHLVEYFDKARMEINNPNGDLNDPSFVTNGLLTVEMVSGAIQTGNSSALPATVPCTIPVVGDPRPDNPLTPGYTTFAAVAS